MNKITKFLMLFVLCLIGMQGNAQNVTVHPGNGSMMPALKSGETDTFYGWSGFATWKHEQLSLTMTTGDSDNNLTDSSNGLTGSGQLAKPANNIFATEGDTFYYITYEDGGKTYYLNTEGKFVTDSKTEWETNNYNEVHSGDVYLYYSTSGNTRYLTVTTYSALGQNYGVRVYNNNYLYVGSNTRYYLTGNATGDTPTFANSTTNAANWTEEVTNTKYLQIGKGRSSTVNGEGVGLDTYITIALPKGYRFTGYTITFHRINRPNGAPSSDLNEWTGTINFGETDNTFTYTSTTNSTDDNLTTYYGGIPQNNTTQHTISRTSDTEMTNVLYFKLDNGRQYTSNTGRAFIQLDHVELYFTAENNTKLVIPSTASGTGRSAIDIPFTTSKVDYGQLIMRDINGVAQGSDGYETGDAAGTGRMSYDGTIRDMNANMILYEDGSVRRDDEANGFDGTVGKMLDYHSGSISAVGDYFQLDPSNHHFLTDDGEAIYYIESPIWAMNTAAGDAAHKNPIGYRIVSAKFTCASGTGGVYLPATFKIQYESTGHGPDENGTYGLNTYSGTYNWNPSYHTVWRIDQEGYIYGYVSYDGSIRYLAVDGNTISMVAEKPSTANGTFKITENNQICLKSDETKYIGWQETVRLDNEGNPVTYTDDEGNVWNRVDRFFVIAADAAHRSTYHEVTAASESSSAAYTFNIYGPDGTTVAETIDGTVGGTKTVYGYNNDAIKIGVIGGTALIKAEITMQALDPYIERLDIVCQENNGLGGKLTQQFSATDFAVKGGQFTFYVPEGFPAPAKFTFNNLYSHYGDETYYGETNSTDHARYFFVKSPYEQTADNVYKRNNEDSYTTKILTEKVGNTKFTFNNASTVGSAGGYFEEYAFNPSSYSSFIDFTFNQTEMTNGTVKTAYLFTCDEPRYNIAPTTATQHVYYAFYEMKIDMQTKTYEPVLTWEKLYESTFDGAGKTDSKWGLKLTTTETVDDHGRHSGYLTVTQILNKIDKRTGDNTVAGGPENTDQILYIDGSKLMSIVENQTSTGTGTNITYTSHPKSELMAALDQNALIYLPYGSESSDDNFAFNTIEDYSKTPIFRGANDIVITDKYSFYAPYAIQVDAAKYAKYSRQISQDINGKVNNATLILPFALEVESGVHTNATDDACSFSLNTMDTGQTIVQNSQSPSYVIPNVQFSTISGTSSEANKPYMVKVLTAATGSDNSNYSFVATQAAAAIAKTPTQSATSTLGQEFYTGETASGTYKYTSVQSGNAVKSVDYTCTAQGNFSGVKYDRTESENVFYFAANKFLNLHTLNAGEPYLLVYPFRSVYTYTGNVPMNSFNVVFGDELEETDAIAEMSKQVDLAVTSGKGFLSMTSAIDQTVNVRSLNGMSVGELNMRAGDSQSINLPAGIYLVNNVKIIVK